VIVCLRTITIPAATRRLYSDWVADGRRLRTQHGMLAELVLEPPDDDGDTVVVTVWPSEAAFDSWKATAQRSALVASDIPEAARYRRFARYDAAVSYLDIAGFERAGRCAEEAS
jgi:heme-degrading monooxygenase HmoA